MTRKMAVFGREDLARSQDFFAVLHTGPQSQIAVMNLREGETSGEYGTEHPQSDQTLFILEGGGRIVVEEESQELETGDAVFIPAGARHRVFGPSRILNVYAHKGLPQG
jgi:mannose-6-phosphate isomerase-like protein (cupin superfamily)